MDLGNMHENGKDPECGSGDVLSDRQTHRQAHRQTYSSQYFATAPEGEAKNKSQLSFIMVALSNIGQTIIFSFCFFFLLLLA